MCTYTPSIDAMYQFPARFVKADNVRVRDDSSIRITSLDALPSIFNPDLRHFDSERITKTDSHEVESGSEEQRPSITSADLPACSAEQAPGCGSTGVSSPAVDRR